MMLEDLRLLAEGFTAQIYKWHDGKALKLYFQEFSGIAEREFIITQKILEMGLSAPQVFETIEINGRVGYVLEKIHGPSYRDLLEDDFLKNKKLAVSLAKEHAKIHHVDLGSVPLDPIIPRVLERVEIAVKALRDLKENIYFSVNYVQGGTTLVHNDFHFGNVLYQENNTTIIDWNGAGAGDRYADVAKSIILMSCAPPGICFGPRAHKHRLEIAQIYFESYDEEVCLDQNLLNHWKIIRAAELIGLKVPFSDILEKEIKNLIKKL